MFDFRYFYNLVTNEEVDKYGTVNQLDDTRITILSTKFEYARMSRQGM